MEIIVYFEKIQRPQELGAPFATSIHSEGGERLKLCFNVNLSFLAVTSKSKGHLKLGQNG